MAMKLNRAIIYKVADSLDRVFIVFSLVFAIACMFNGDFTLGGIWFTAHGAASCTQLLHEILDALEAKK